MYSWLIKRCLHLFYLLSCIHYIFFTLKPTFFRYLCVWSVKNSHYFSFYFWLVMHAFPCMLHLTRSIWIKNKIPITIGNMHSLCAFQLYIFLFVRILEFMEVATSPTGVPISTYDLTYHLYMSLNEFPSRTFLTEDDQECFWSIKTLWCLC